MIVTRAMQLNAYHFKGKELSSAMYHVLSPLVQCPHWCQLHYEDYVETKVFVSKCIKYCKMAAFSVSQFSLIFHFWVFPLVVLPERRGDMLFFLLTNFPVLFYF